MMMKNEVGDAGNDKNTIKWRMKVITTVSVSQHEEYGQIVVAVQQGNKYKV